MELMTVNNEQRRLCDHFFSVVSISLIHVEIAIPH